MGAISARPRSSEFLAIVDSAPHIWYVIPTLSLPALRTGDDVRKIEQQNQYIWSKQLCLLRYVKREEEIGEWPSLLKLDILSLSRRARQNRTVVTVVHSDC